MLKKSFQLFGFSCIAGIFGAFFRWLQSLNAFEPETGLAIPGAPWSIAMAAYMLLFAVALFLFIRRFKGFAFAQDYSGALGSPSPVFDVVGVVFGILLGLGGIALFVPALTPPYSIFQLITGLFALVAAAAMVVFFRSTGLDHASSRGGTSSVLVDLFLCFWLIACYKVFASEPVLWSFAPRLLAICASVLAFYYLAGYAYRKPRPLLCLYFSNLAVFLLIISLADSYALGSQLITLSLAGALSLASMLQLNNAAPGQEQ